MTVSAAFSVLVFFAFAIGTVVGYIYRSLN